MYLQASEVVSYITLKTIKFRLLVVKPRITALVDNIIIFPNHKHTGIYLCIRDSESFPGGELVLGGTDPNYFTGSFHYVSTKGKGKWEIIMKG